MKTVYRIFFLFLVLSLSSCMFNPEKVKLERYRVAGERIYERACSNCHQPDGSGFRGLYPPLAGADFLKNERDLSICIIKNGYSDSLTVNRKVYTQPMPAMDLTALEVAEVTTYIYNSWGNPGGLIGVKEVEGILLECPNK